MKTEEEIISLNNRYKDAIDEAKDNIQATINELLFDVGLLQNDLKDLEKAASHKNLKELKEFLTLSDEDWEDLSNYSF